MRSKSLVKDLVYGEPLGFRVVHNVVITLCSRLRCSIDTNTNRNLLMRNKRFRITLLIAFEF